MGEFYAVMLKVTLLYAAAGSTTQGAPWLCPLRWVVCPLVLREQPQHCLFHIPVPGGWVRAMLRLSIPRRMTPLMPPIVAWGAWVWVPHVGGQEACGHLWRGTAASGLSTLDPGPATHVGLHCPGCVRGSQPPPRLLFPQLSVSSLLLQLLSLVSQVYRSAFGL